MASVQITRSSMADATFISLVAKSRDMTCDAAAMNDASSFIRGSLLSSRVTGFEDPPGLRLYHVVSKKDDKPGTYTS